MQINKAQKEIPNTKSYVREANMLRMIHEVDK